MKSRKQAPSCMIPVTTPLKRTSLKKFCYHVYQFAKAATGYAVQKDVSEISHENNCLGVSFS